MKIILNGKEKELDEKIKNLQQYIELIQRDKGGVIVELNGKIIKNGERENLLLKDSDKIELIQFMGEIGRAHV